MDDFLKQLKKKCRAEISQYGFIQKKNVFARIVNDVFQSFHIEKIVRSFNLRECRIGFAVLPLCQKLDANWVLSGVDKYYLREFEVTHWTEGDDWKYKIDSDEISSCIDEILVYISRYLIPFFERSDTCKTALPEIVKLEKLFNDNRKESLRQSGKKDMADPYAEINLIDSVKYYMALKNGDLDFALKCRRALLKQNVDSYNSMAERGYLIEEDRLRREKAIAMLRNEINEIEYHNEVYIQQIIVDNEAYSQENLKSIF